VPAVGRRFRAATRVCDRGVRCGEGSANAGDGGRVTVDVEVQFGVRLAPYPEVTGALIGRALQRARSLAVTMAIAHQRRVDRRLLMLFWHLADRWGRVTPAGVRVPLQVTHQILADLVASRRPAVTTALAQLEHAGHVTRIESGWLLAAEGRAGLDDVTGTHRQRT